MTTLTIPVPNELAQLAFAWPDVLAVGILIACGCWAMAYFLQRDKR